MSSAPVAPSAHARSALTGIALTVVACALFAFMDGTTKFAGAALPMLMVVWLRFLVQALVTTAIVLPQQGLQALRTAHPKFQAARAITGLLTTVFGFFCIQSMPLANFTATWSVVPLLIVVASALLFKEHVSVARWVLLVIGLGAVIVIIRPEHSDQPLGWAALYPVCLLLCGTTYQILGSRLARLDAPFTTQLYTTWLPLLLSAPLMPFVWQSVGHWHLWVALVVIGVCGAVGHLLLLIAYTHATPATISPFLYTQIGFATLMGWASFGQVPDGLSMLGMLAITLCGFASIGLSVRERR